MKQQTIISSFINAFNGLVNFFVRDRNGRIEFCAAVIAISFGFWLHISVVEWMAVLLCIGAVISLEMLNSAVEKLCDMVHAEYHPIIKVIKDIAAGAVLFASMISVIIACIIFLPKLFLVL